MAVSAQLAAALRVGSHYTSLVADDISWSEPVASVVTTTFATVPFTSRAPGLKTFDLVLGTMNDYADDAADELARGMIGTTQPCSLAPEGDLAGNLALVGQGVVTKYSPFAGKVGEVPRLNLMLTGTGQMAEGKMSIDGATTRTATTNGTAVQQGAITSGKAVYAACHLTTFGGTITSVTFSLQSDNASNFPSATTVATGSALTAVGGSWLTSSSVTTDDWWRVVATVVGASPSFVVAAAIAVL